MHGLFFGPHWNRQESKRRIAGEFDIYTLHVTIRAKHGQQLAARWNVHFFPPSFWMPNGPQPCRLPSSPLYLEGNERQGEKQMSFTFITYFRISSISRRTPIFKLTKDQHEPHFSTKKKWHEYFRICLKYKIVKRENIRIVRPLTYINNILM